MEEREEWRGEEWRARGVKGESERMWKMKEGRRRERQRGGKGR